MTIAVANSNWAQNAIAYGDESACAATFPNASSSGNLIVVVLSSWGPTIAAPSDNKGNTYSLAVSVVGAADVSIYYSKNITGGSGHVITGNFEYVEDCERSICIGEFSGVDTESPLDGTPTGRSLSSTSDPTPGAITPTGEGNIFIGGCSQHETRTVTATSPFTMLVQTTSDTGEHQPANLNYLIATDSLSKDPAFNTTGGSCDWTIAGASFKASGGPTRRRIIIIN